MDKRLEDIVGRFNKIEGWEGRYKLLISLGKDLADMKVEDKVETNKVNGCQSQVWLSAELKDGMILFSGDSDASIVKGIVALLILIYSDRKPEDILTLPKDFIDMIGLKQQLSMSRANGLSSMMKQIQLYAFGFKTKIEMGLT
jgi:cysteine desulfuration protein SufE